MTRPRGFFVTGTDTGVGKTVVACALARGLRRRGLRVGVLKPSETGVPAEGPADARALREAAGCDEPLAMVCPQPFALPAAPEVSARAEGRGVDMTRIRACYDAIHSRHDATIVEGAGGLLVPLAPGCSMVDLAADLGLPLIVVARARLGTINHIRLTLEAIRARGLCLAGVVVSHADGALSPADEANLSWLLEHLGDEVVGVVPPLAPGQEVPDEALDWGRLLAARGAERPGTARQPGAAPPPMPMPPGSGAGPGPAA